MSSEDLNWLSVNQHSGMIPLCSSFEDGSNLSATVFTKSSDCCIRAGQQIWWAVIPPARKSPSSCRV